MKKRTKVPGSGRKKGPPTVVRRIPKSVEPALDKLIEESLKSVSPSRKQKTK